MKILPISFLLLPVLILAETPNFQAWNYVNASGSPIQLSVGHAAPCVVDWDGDGLKDLLVGQYSGGMIRLYLNSGTNSAPVFTSYTYLQADGSTIQLPYG
jgi:hypothetical protein